MEQYAFQRFQSSVLETVAQATRNDRTRSTLADQIRRLSSEETTRQQDAWVQGVLDAYDAAYTELRDLGVLSR